MINIIKSDNYAEDALFLERKLFEYNQQQVEDYSYEPIILKINDKTGKIIAGINCTIGNNWLHIESLWVADNQRNKGFGKTLLKKAEEIAVHKKCVGSYLYSYGFQNPKFYEKSGYKEFGRLNEFGKSNKFYLMKKLV